MFFKQISCYINNFIVFSYIEWIVFNKFFSEVIEKLGNRSINIGNLRPDNLTNENAVQLLQQHKKFHYLYGEQIEYEIEYVSSQLFRESNGNISEKVGMTASSNLDSLIIVTQYDNNSCYQSYNEQNPWICFDFKDKKNNSNKLPNEVLLRRSFILLSSEELDRWRIKRQQSMGNYCNRKQLFLPQWIFQLFYVFNFLTILEFKVLLLVFHIQVLIHQTVYEDF